MTLPDFLKTCLKAAALFLCLSLIGIMVNQFSSSGIALRYSPPPSRDISGLKVPLIGEKEAAKYLNELGYVFVDTRHPEHFREGHIPGAVFLPPDDLPERFEEVQPLLMDSDTLILYCYGPDCDMAEKTAEFLAQMGYSKFMIMTDGFSGWKSAGNPIETARR